MHIRKIIYLSTLILLSTSALTQEQVNTIEVLTRVKKAEVWLRWAPSNPQVWEVGKRFGYVIERFELSSDGQIDRASETQLTDIALKPYGEEQFDTLTSLSSEAGALKELIYGQSNENKPDNATLKDIMDQKVKLENRFGLSLFLSDQSIELAQAAGLFYADKSITAGQRYVYRISLAENPFGLSVKKGVKVVDAREDEALTGFNDLKANFGDRVITLSWDVVFHKGVYAAYIIEKSVDGVKFTQATDEVYVHVSQSANPEKAYFVDSLESNNLTYYYRVKGITPFGETGPASNLIEGQGKSNLSGTVIIDGVDLLKDDKVKITWRFPKELESKIAGFKVYRSTHAESSYEVIGKNPFPAKQRQYNDEHAFQNTYYKVEAVDKDLNRLTMSFPYLVHLEDNAPPEIPKNLIGESNNKGIVLLAWSEGEEKDLLGYRVFSANAPQEEFVEVTRQILVLPYYIDSLNLNVLNKAIYYKVVALDQNYNISGYSEAVQVERPDVIAPIAPIIHEIRVEKNGVFLQWTASSSNDVQEYVLERLENDTTTINVEKWGVKDLPVSFNDKSVVQGNWYKYTLTAVDKRDNRAPSDSRRIYYENGVRKDVTEFKALINRTEKTITLKWSYYEPFTRCHIYRKTNDGPYSLYKTLEGNIQETLDDNVLINNIYAYKIKLVFDNRASTKLSKALRVQF